MSIISLSHSGMPYNSKRGHPLPKNLWGPLLSFHQVQMNYSLTAPIEMPLVKYFWNMMKMMSIGMAATVAPAIL